MKPVAKPAAASAVTFRAATRADIPVILGLIRELAEYERLAREVVATEEILTRNLFGPRAYAECLIGEVGGQIAGFTLFFHNFSTFLGKPGIFIEDIYVKPDYRSHGIGMGFFREIARLALERDCGRIEWSVLDWNEPAIKFYQKLGAKPQDEWTVQRLMHAEIEALAKSS